jgi:hypothetical protein
MLSNREAEKARLDRQRAVPVAADRTIVAHPARVKRYEQKVATLREALNNETIKAERSRRYAR